MIKINKFKKYNFGEFAIVLSTLPIVTNFLLTFREEIKYQILKYFFLALPLTILLFLFFLMIGIAIKEIFELKTISFAIAASFGTIFMFNNIFLFLTANIDFRILVYCYLFLLFLLFLFKLEKPKNYFIVFLSIILIFLINLLSNQGLFFDQHLELFTSDEARLWFPTTQSIYEQNYLIALQSSSIEGYGVYSAYIKSFISIISSYNNLYVYNPSTSNLFLIFFFLMIYEIEANRKIKLTLSVLFFSIFFTNNWINYLFFNSLLGEGPAGFIFGATIFEITKSEKKIPIYLLLFLSFNVYGKNFLTVLTVLLIIYACLKYKKLFYLMIGIFPILISLINASLYEVGYLWQFYFSDSNTQRNNDFWSPINFLEMIKQFYVDKTLTIVFIVIIALYVLSKQKLKKLFLNEYLGETIFFVNIIVVFVVYIFLVEELEAIQDSYRYLITTLYLLPLTLAKFTENND